MRRCLAGLCLFVAMGACAPQPDTSYQSYIGKPAILDVTQGKRITQAELVAVLRQADIVILGEYHDNPEHHQVQAEIVSQLQPKALAAEMIPQASEEGIAVFLEQGGDPGQIGPAIGWEKLGWPDWQIYRPVFEAADLNRVFGGGLPRKQIIGSIRSGARATAAAAADAVLVRALDAPLPEGAQAAMETQMIVAHCNKLPESAAPGMVEAQRLRDASFAAAALRAFQAGGGPVVLITGNGHARKDRAVPLYLRQLAPELSVVSVGIIESDLAVDGPDLPPQPYDFVWATLVSDRDDPCVDFRHKKE